MGGGLGPGGGGGRIVDLRLPVMLHRLVTHSCQGLGFFPPAPRPCLDAQIVVECNALLLVNRCCSVDLRPEDLVGPGERDPRGGWVASSAEGSRFPGVAGQADPCPMPNPRFVVVSNECCRYECTRMYMTIFFSFSD